MLIFNWRCSNPLNRARPNAAKAGRNLRDWGTEIGDASGRHGGNRRDQSWHNTPCRKACRTRPIPGPSANARVPRMAIPPRDLSAACRRAKNSRESCGRKSFVDPGETQLFRWRAIMAFQTSRTRRKMLVRLRAADTQKILAESFPPRHDVAQTIPLGLERVRGTIGFIWKSWMATMPARTPGWRWDVSARRLWPCRVLIRASIAERKLAVANRARIQAGRARTAIDRAGLKTKEPMPSVRDAAALALVAINPERAHFADQSYLQRRARKARLCARKWPTRWPRRIPRRRAWRWWNALRTAPDRLQIKMALGAGGQRRRRGDAVAIDGERQSFAATVAGSFDQGTPRRHRTRPTPPRALKN